MPDRRGFRDTLRIMAGASLACAIALACAASPGFAGDEAAAPKVSALKRGVKGGREKTPIEMSRQEALWTALAFEDTAELKKQLESGAGPDEPDRLSLMTPLMVVETYDLAAILLDAGANPKATDRDGRTVLHYAVRMREAARIVPLLVSRGADPNARAGDGLGTTPLLAAMDVYLQDADKTRALGAISSLVKAGADPNLPDEKGEMPLAKAEAMGDKNLVKLLSSLGGRRASEVRTIRAGAV